MSLLDKNINAQFFDIYKVTKKNDSLQLIIVSVNIYILTLDEVFIYNSFTIIVHC